MKQLFTLPLSKVVVATAVLGTTLAASGCAKNLPTQPGQTNYRKFSGELAANENTPINTVWEASQRALEALELRVITRDKDALSAIIEAEGAEGKDVQVRLERLNDYSTMVKIKVGLLGDQLQSRLILDKIQEEISAPAVY